MILGGRGCFSVKHWCLVMCCSFLNYFSELLHFGEWMKYFTFWKWSTSFTELCTKCSFNRGSFSMKFLQRFSKLFLYFLKNVCKISPEFYKCYSFEVGAKGAIQKKKTKKNCPRSHFKWQSPALLIWWSKRNLY